MELRENPKLRREKNINNNNNKIPSNNKGETEVLKCYRGKEFGLNRV